jgi:quinol monooxygenase YgiN
MTAIVMTRYRTTVAEFEAAERSGRGELRALAQAARTEGCLHHRVAGSDDDREVVIIDEWQDEEAYNRFMLNPAVVEILRRLGLHDPPESDYYRTIYDPIEF